MALGVSASVASAQIAFTDVTKASGVAHSSETYGASWGDLDGDGYPDLFVSNHRTMTSLFVNMGNGTFVDVARANANLAEPAHGRHPRRILGRLQQRRRLRI